uniref:Beta-parvin n=1 Tax=Bactrocera latifrons TaxID=174628 RepID=A0A0K8U090_BACLA
MMSLRRPKSPHMGHNVKSAEKEESFWEKFSTIGRKKGTKEVQKVEEEGKHAIESPGLPNQFDIPPEDYTLRDLEQRAVIDPQSLNNPEVIKLQRILIDWLNDELAEQRIIVQSIEEDLYDGQVRHFILFWKSWNKMMLIHIKCFVGFA